MKEKLEKIIKNYGTSNQLKKLSEELFEFQEAVRDYEYLYEDSWTELIDERDKKYKKHIEEEFADVMVIMEQFKAYYNLDNNNIIDIMNMKIKRQIDRIESEKKNNG